MKNKIAILLLILVPLLSACNKTKNCQSDNVVCNDVPPTDELCEAYFVRWFYDASTNSCEEIGYSGCSAKGFATEAECEACLCD